MKRFFFLLVASLLVCSFVFSQKAVSYEVYALKYATLASPNAAAAWAAGAPAKDSVDIIFMFWLLKGDNGKNVLVDAGCKNDLQNAIDFGLTNFIRPDSVLLQTGLKAEDITDIIISHPHWDHLDGISLFPNAQIWIQQEDYNYFVGQAWQKDARSGGFAKRDILYLVEQNIAGKVTLVKGDDKEIIPGIKVYTGSKHTYNSQYVLVKTGADKIIIASDNIWIYDNLLKMLPAPSYGTFDAKAYVGGMQRMKTLASKIDFIIPGHDAKLFSKFPKVTEDIIRIR